jgi:WD40 repeat protein
LTPAAGGGGAMDAAIEAAARPRAALDSAQILWLFRSDVRTPILRLAGSGNGLLVTKGVARDGRAVAARLRKILWQDRIAKGAAIFKGPAGDVECCAFSPDGKRLVTVSYDRTARLWDVETGALRATLEGHTAHIWSCAFSPDGTRVVTAGYNQTARL